MGIFPFYSGLIPSLYFGNLYYKVLRHEECQRSEKQMLFCPNLLTSEMNYDRSYRFRLTNQTLLLSFFSILLTGSSPLTLKMESI